jgi:hypothetical protein
MMRSKTLTTPELALLVGTRVAFGIGIGLLLAGRLEKGVRLGAGGALAAVGALTTIPLVLSILGQDKTVESKHNSPGQAGTEPLAGPAGSITGK